MAGWRDGGMAELQSAGPGLEMFLCPSAPASGENVSMTLYVLIAAHGVAFDRVMYPHRANWLPCRHAKSSEIAPCGQRARRILGGIYYGGPQRCKWRYHDL